MFARYGNGRFCRSRSFTNSQKSFLKKFNKRTGWIINWSKFDNDVEVYALVIQGTVDIQGLVAIQKDDSAQAVHILWMVAAPQNNPQITNKKKYSGVGGHLFAIAGNLSIKYGYDGFVYGEPMDEKLMHHYEKVFNAERLPRINSNIYRILINDQNMQKIVEEYNYDMVEDEL